MDKLDKLTHRAIRLGWNIPKGLKEEAINWIEDALTSPNFNNKDKAAAIRSLTIINQQNIDIEKINQSAELDAANPTTKYEITIKEVDDNKTS